MLFARAIVSISNPSSVVTLSLTRFLATRRSPLASSHLTGCRPWRTVSLGNMSTAAVLPQQTQHFPQPEAAPTSTSPRPSDRETQTSSTSSTRSGSKSRGKEEQRGQQRMSTYFPLGYKEAAYQWVSLPVSLASAPTAIPGPRPSVT
jgi:hypothetical protein